MSIQSFSGRDISRDSLINPQTPRKRKTPKKSPSNGSSFRRSRNERKAWWASLTSEEQAAYIHKQERSRAEKRYRQFVDSTKPVKFERVVPAGRRKRRIDDGYDLPIFSHRTDLLPSWHGVGINSTPRMK